MYSNITSWANLLPKHLGRVLPYILSAKMAVFEQLFKRRFGSKVRPEQTNLCGNRLIIPAAAVNGHNKPSYGVGQEGVYNFQPVIAFQP